MYNRFVNWFRYGQTVAKDDATELMEMADLKEQLRSSGATHIPIKQGVEARYFSFGKWGVLKTFQSNFDEKVKYFDSINPRLDWLIEHGERVPFLYGIAERDTKDKSVYKQDKTDYVFMDNLVGEQFFDIRLQNTMLGFGNPSSYQKWENLPSEKQSEIMNYMEEKLGLMADIPQEDYNRLLKGMIRLDGINLASDCSPHNMIFGEDIPKGEGRFGFVDLRQPESDPDVPLYRSIECLKNAGSLIPRTLERKGKFSLWEKETMQAQSLRFTEKISAAVESNRGLKDFIDKSHLKGLKLMEMTDKKSL